MMKAQIAGLGVVLACLMSGGWAAAETMPLFNGENLDGWYTWIEGRGKNDDPDNTFTVEEGVIKIAGEAWGCITTEEAYENYHLVMEWRWTGTTYGKRAERARDSGLLVHSVGEDGAYGGIWMHSIEVQMIEGGSGDFIVVGDGSDNFEITAPCAETRHGGTPVYEPGGDPVSINQGRINWWGRDPNWEDTLGFRGAQDVENPVGEWNRFEVTCAGDTIKVVLNGVIVNEAFNVSPNKGQIQIQAEGAALEVRSVTLTSLEAAE